MQVLLVGASGQIGGHLRRLLEAAGHSVVGTYATVEQPGLRRLDLDDTAAMDALVAEVEPHLVILAAGWTWVDGNEDDPQASFRRNCEHPLYLARLAAESGARFVTYSTDYVFDGERGPYGEADPTNPLNVYGKAKEALEQGLSELGLASLCLRTSTVYGPEAQGKNFVYQLVRRLRAGQPFRVPTDQVACPSYSPDVAAATLSLIEMGANGIWHVTGPDAMSREDFTREACAVFDLDPSAVEYLPTSELNQKAQRPLSAALDTAKLLAAGIQVRGVRAGLEALKAAAVEGSGYAAL